MRLWLAQIFWASGLQKITNWETALYLSANEYPVTWMDPVTAAYTGVAIEIICPIFLALGLATRAAAVPMLILSIVIHVEYQQLNTQVYWARHSRLVRRDGSGRFLPRSNARTRARRQRLAAGRADRAAFSQSSSAGSGHSYLLFLRCFLALAFFASGQSSDVREAVLVVVRLPISRDHSGW